MTRRALLLGSLPFDNEAQAMERALEVLGPHLASLPDGEIGDKSDAYPAGDRAAWVQIIMDRCEADTANWTVKRATKRNANGFSVNYDTGPRVKAKHPPKEMAAHLNFGWADFARQSYPRFRELRAASGLTGLKFQVGLPTAMGMTFGMMSPIDAFRYAGAFNERLAIEANEILDFADPGDVQFQLEVPGELAMAYKLPKQAAPVAVRTVLGLLKAIRPEAGFGIHLCMGDLNNEALFSAKSLEKMVNFTNVLMAKWPASHQLDYVHVPLAEAADPPPVTSDWYAPLANMNLPSGVRFVAGFVHDKRSDDEHDKIRDIVDALRPDPVDIACSCGMGRQSTETAEKLLVTTERLVNS